MAARTQRAGCSRRSGRRLRAPCSAAVSAAPSPGPPVSSTTSFPPLRLGSLALQSAAILSPMEGVSCAGFRDLCWRQGAGLTWTEMVRASALARNNAATLALVDTFGEAPTGVQLLASNPDELTAALRRLVEAAAADRPYIGSLVAVDLNLGCPSPAVIRAGAGPALLKRRSRLAQLFDALVAFKASTRLRVGAVGCKIRLGLNAVEAEARVYLNLVDCANAAGLDYITVHARHAGQRSREPPRWAAIGEVRSRAALSMAVIGNGDVRSLADALALRAATGCDGVMLARAAIRNPLVFADFVAAPAGDSAAAAAAPAAPPAPVNWDGGRVWMDAAQVDEAERAYSQSAASWGTRPKFVAFHAANFARLRAVAATGDRATAVAAPATIHLS